MITAGVAVLLTFALRKNHAQMRYWLWLAASVKFLIPFSLLVTLGNQFEWRTAPAIGPTVSTVVELELAKRSGSSTASISTIFPPLKLRTIISRQSSARSYYDHSAASRSRPQSHSFVAVRHSSDERMLPDVTSIATCPPQVGPAGNALLA